MGSSGGSANPMFLSQGGTPMPNVPIAGQGELKPQERGSFQSFLPDLPAAGGGPAPSATGLTSEMLQYRSPQGVVAAGGGGGGAVPAAPAAPGGDLRSQLAAVAAEGGGAEFGLGGATNTWGGGAGDFGGWGGGGNGQFGAARSDGGGGGGAPAHSPGFHDWQFTGAHGVPFAPRPRGWG